MRISQRQQLATATKYLHQNQARVEELRTQLGTQKRILQPDDDPQGTQQAINLRTYLPPLFIQCKQAIEVNGSAFCL